MHLVDEIQIQFHQKQMRASKLQKIQKQPLPKNPPPPTSAIKFSYHNYTNLTNEQYLFHALKLLNITDAEYFKETKLSMSDQIFGKNQSPTTTKQFFFIVFVCLKYLCNQEEFSMVKIWYPPRSFNEQLQFKKAIYTVFTKLQARNKIPQNLLISKNFLMGQTPTHKIVGFLRILSELALRSHYLQNYSRKERLIYICFAEIQNQQQQPNDINRFYVYPFAPGQTAPNISLDEQEIQVLSKVYKNHIEIYRKKILSLASKYPKQELISCQELMANLVQQKQLTETLNKKIPKYVLSQNRAFDRRKLIDKSRYVWEKLNNISCLYIQKPDTQSVLKLEGQIDKILLKWETPTGVNKMLDVIQITEKLKLLKENCSRKMKQFEQFYNKLNFELKKYES